MQLRTTGLTGVVIVACALFAGCHAMAQLARWSPFLPPMSATAPPTESSLEYLGFIQTSEGFQFRLRAPAQRAAAFVKLDVPDTDLGVIARRHDLESGTLTLEHRGRTLTLPERTAKVRPSGAVGTRNQAYVAPPVTSVPAAVTQSVVLNPTPAQEQDRLAAFAAEVNRRREERARTIK